MKGIILFNPFSAVNGYRIPNSVLQVAASVKGKYNYVIIDGNRETDPWKKIESLLSSHSYKYFGCTVMPGPQLNQAISFTKQIKINFPDIVVIWGGYFPSNQFEVVMHSGLVDFIIDGPADHAFPNLLNCIDQGKDLTQIQNVVYIENGSIVKTRKEPIPDMENLPDLPYEKLFEQYSPEGYLKKTFLGSRTAAYHSSFGCPFTCSFCAVVPIYNARWKGFSANRIFRDINYLIHSYQVDAVEFHDNNFFVSQERTVEFSKLISSSNIRWWGEGRIDTIDKYSDKSLDLMRNAGCRMIFFGAETGNDEILKQMDKGGTQTAEQILRFAQRMKKFDIIPEYSFVLGLPAESEEKVMEQIDSDIEFIKLVKKENPDTEIIIYIYSPVPTEGSELYHTVTENGFRFPEKLEDWLDPRWMNFDLRKNPMTPWLKPYMIDKIRNFETVLNAYSPTVSDFKLTAFQRRTMKQLSRIRYNRNWFQFPLELKILQKYWLHYRQPEIEGFFLEP